MNTLHFGKQNFKNNLKTFFWKLRWWKTKAEKVRILKKHLTRIYCDYDITTGETNIFPSMRAEREIRKMQRLGTLDYHYELLQIRKKSEKETRKLAKKYKIRQISTI